WPGIAARSRVQAPNRANSAIPSTTRMNTSAAGETVGRVRRVCRVSRVCPVRTLLTLLTLPTLLTVPTLTLPRSESPVPPCQPRHIITSFLVEPWGIAGRGVFDCALRATGGRDGAVDSMVRKDPLEQSLRPGLHAEFRERFQL